MQDGATSHTANLVKPFLIQTFGEDRIVVGAAVPHGLLPVSRFNTGRLLVVGIFEISRVSIGPSSLSELKDAIRRGSILRTSGHVEL
ncbi:hypothetical protein TNCV_58401 [Trichonephila clavipes]|nr:hypothetical protein TNCV_58401 [Trichonephila clavipes]